MVDFVVGGVARDDDFFFRKNDLEDLWDMLVKNNVLLLSPRRNGKTSVMYRMLDQPEPGWRVVHLNVEDLNNPVDFIINLINALHEHQPEYLHRTLSGMSGFFGGLFGRIQSVEVFNCKLELRKSTKLAENWRDHANELMETLCKANEKLLFIIDELPDMLTAMAERHQEEFSSFLHWFRKLRERTMTTKIRWLIGGSVNLTAVLDRQGMVRVINDLRTINLPPFSIEETTRFFEMTLVSRDVKYEKEALDKVVELLGAPIPFFLQLFTQELYRFWKRSDKPTLTADHVSSVFNKALLGEVARDKLQHFRTRIDTHYCDDKAVACRILDTLSARENGASRNILIQLFRKVKEEQGQSKSVEELKQEFDRLLLYLQTDFYIEEIKDNVFDFANRLLKIWWRKHYGYDIDE